MNKNAIQKYAVWARNELISQVKQRAYLYGIDEKGYGDENAVAVNGRVLTPSERIMRIGFIHRIRELTTPYSLTPNPYAAAFGAACEEVAYTWFNRFAALRYMEVNDFLPTHIRVFSDANGDFNPEILKDVLHLDLEGLDKTKVAELLNANKTDELYRYLLLTQCNALNSALPEMFEKLGGYTEMLLPGNILKSESVIGRLVSDIPEEDWKDAVQIIGWLYQYYNTEPKQAVFDGLKKNVKITKEKIPAATQLFTPDWIVRYMVENSLGRTMIANLKYDIWADSEKSKIDVLLSKWRYYIDDAEQIDKVRSELGIMEHNKFGRGDTSFVDVTLIDPCMGSGHILVYAFDVLMDIYRMSGYSDRDAAKSILENNLYGLDIDRRAYQLAYFSLMMKARQYNRRIFTENVRPQVYHPMGWSDGEEYGSLIKIDDPGKKPEPPKELTLFDEDYETALRVWNFKRLLSQKYDVVVTNPPYMGSSGMSGRLSEYVKKNYPDSKSDMFAVFIEKCAMMLKPNGYQAMITQHAWMFLSSYEKLRTKLQTRDTINMAHLGARAFAEIGGEVVQSTAFVMRGGHIKNYKGIFVRLVECQNYQDKEDTFLSGRNRYVANNSDFAKISGSPVSAYFLKPEIIQLFEHTVGNELECKTGLICGDNSKYIRSWQEVDFEKISFETNSLVGTNTTNKKWFPYNHGGERTRWYGGHYEIVNLYHNAFEMRQEPNSMLRNSEWYYKEGITWNRVGNGSNFHARIAESGFVFDDCSPTGFTSDLYSLLAYLNSPVFDYFLSLFSSGFKTEIGHIQKVAYKKVKSETVTKLCKQNISLSRADWDAFETSWDFKRHPLIGGKSVAAAFDKWEKECDERFNTLKANEEELNRIFIDIYGLQDELTPEVEDKDVTVRPADKTRDIKSLISYAVGCMFGRYSLDVDGLAYAGGEWDGAKYTTFVPDRDNVLPICDDEYFDDDIAGRFVDFVKTVYGADTLEDNLRFIAEALGGSGTPREVIRKYFLNDFYKDHLKIYQKRPIYWLFDSGKKNGFKALVYLHRYTPDLLAKLRTDYVHEQQERYRTQLKHTSDAMNGASGSERAKLLKQQEKLTAQAQEIAKFEEKVHHLADMNIDLDLDDGVKVNYAKFCDVLGKI
jgi:hypothetical protein